MTTIVNSPAPTTTDSGGNNILMGVIIVLGFIGIFLYFGLPAIRRMGPVQLNVPAPQVVIPGKIDVNVNQTK